MDEAPPCVLPFRLEGQTDLSCTTRSLSDSPEVFLPPRCPTKVEPVSLEASREVGDWGRCDRDCPLRQYRDNSQLNRELERLSEVRPEVAQLFSLGQSVRGEKISGLRLTAEATRDRRLLTPMVWLVANMHGNEVVGREVLTELATLLTMVEDDPRLERILRVFVSVWRQRTQWLVALVKTHLDSEHLTPHTSPPRAVLTSG